jgi:hypothetical protein
MGLQMGEKNRHPGDEACKAMRWGNRSVEVGKEKKPQNRSSEAFTNVGG